MADFEIAYKKTAINEGGYANDKADRGGETWRGIARNIFPQWPGWLIVDGCKSKPGFPGNLEKEAGLQSMVVAFYHANFWNPIQGDRIIDQEAANNIYDSAVNTGVGPAVKMAQAALGLPETGKMDTITLNKLNNKG